MCFVVQTRPISYCASLRGHIILISNVGLEEPVQIGDNPTLGWGLMAVAYVKSTSSACANSCVVSWVRGFWTAPRQLKSLKRADELQHCSSPVKQSPRTNTEGGWSHSCVRKGARTPLVFFLNLPLPCRLNSLHYLEHPSSGALWQTRNRSCDSRWSVLPPFFFCLFLFLRHFWGTFCLSFLLRWHAQPSVQLPPATREAANLGRPHGRPRQMSPGGHWGGRGHGGRVAEQAVRERAPNRDVRPEGG